MGDAGSNHLRHGSEQRAIGRHRFCPGNSSIGTNGFVYSQKSGTVLGTGTTTLSVTFTPQDSVDYKQATASVQLVVGSAPANSEATVTDTITTGTNPAAVAVNPVTNNDLRQQLRLKHGYGDCRRYERHVNR